MKGGGEQVTLPNRDHPTCGRTRRDAAQHLDVGGHRLDPGRAYEYGVDRPALDAIDVHRRFERVDLAAEGIAAHGHPDAAEAALVRAAVEHLVGEHDHAGAGAVGGH